MIISEQILDKAKVEFLKTARGEIENLVKNSQEEYIRENISPVKKEGYNVKDNALNGIFIAPELHWDLIVQKLREKNYVDKKHDAGKMMEMIMGLKDVFPPTAIEKNFTQDPTVSSFCKAEIKFKPRLLSKSDAVYHLKTVQEKAHEADDWAKPLSNWLQGQKIPGFYYVVEFEIVCSFDFLQYWDSRLKHAEQEADPFKEIAAKIKEKGGDKRNLIKNLVSGATTQLQEEAEELAEWAIEYVAKEQVFEDLSNAIEAACEASSAEKESTPREARAIKEETAENQGSPEIASSPKHRILIYKPTNLKLVIEILQPELTNDKIRLKKVEGRINLAEEIVARIEVRNYETEQEIVVDRNLKVVIEPGYFKGKTITFERGSACKWTLSKSKEFRFIQSEAKLHPDIDKITRNQENLVKYPVTFKLVRSAGDNVSGDTMQYCKAQLNVEFALPKIRFDVTRPYFPRKGEQFDVTFDVKCKSISSLDYEIPVKVVCYPGADFSTVKPLSGTEKAISEKLHIRVSQNKGGTKGNTDNEESNTAKFTLIAKRASFPGYYNSAYFEFFVGDHQEAVQEWRLNITTLPNLMDTFVTGGTGLLGVLSVAYPEMFPAVTQGLSIANLEIIPATIYLVYRVLNWSRKT